MVSQLRPYGLTSFALCLSFMCRSKSIIRWHLPFPWQHDPSKLLSACGLPVNWSFLQRIATQLVYFLSCVCTSAGPLSDVMNCTSLAGMAFFFLPSDLSKTYHYPWDHDVVRWTTWLSQILLPTNVKSKFTSIPKVINEDTEQTRTDLKSCPFLIVILQLQNSFNSGCDLCFKERKKSTSYLYLKLLPNENRKPHPKWRV